MKRIFIFDACPRRIWTMYHSLRSCGHDVMTNMSNVESLAMTKYELDPVRAIRRMWEVWEGKLPQTVIVDSLDVDSAKFLEELHKPSFRSDIRVILMTPETPRANTLVERLMASYQVFCMPRPFEVNRFLNFVDTIPVHPQPTTRVFEPGVIFNRFSL